MGDTQSPALNDDESRTTEQSISWWRGSAIVGVALAVAIGTLIALWLLARPITLLLIAIIIAQALTPLVTRLERWVSRGIAVVIVYFALLLAVGGIGWLVIPPLIAEAQTWS